MTREELKDLLEDMSLEEKIGQMVQLMVRFYENEAEDVLTGPAMELGVTAENIRMAGSVLGTAGAKRLIEIQRKYMEEQPHHIPMLFMMDIIHGMKTIFPIPLAQGATFEPELSEKCAEVMAKESAVSGLHVTFAPMVDLVRDARWGRVMESTGEDPYLNSLFAKAIVRGLQGEDMAAPYKICACIKHFAAYGAATAGRDYNTVELSEHTLREFYLPAYEAGIRAGAGLVMTAFNTVNGIPASANRWLLRDVLRNEMGFDGVLISDYAAILEMIAHGYSEDVKDAARKALEAGVDIDMMTNVYAANLPELAAENQMNESLIDEAVFRILELKNRLGLFENPYKDADPEKEKTVLLCEEHRRLAKEMAEKSFVLLKNEDILPISENRRTAFIGPYVDNKEIISTWAFTGECKDCVTIREAAEEDMDLSKVTFHQGSQLLGDHVRLTGFDKALSSGVCKPEEIENMLTEAIEAARNADVVVMALGEHYMQSGEAASRGMIDIPEVQMRLFREIRKVNENIAVVLFSGRPLDLREISESAKAILEVWLPGTEGGHAIIDVLTGRVNPSGKLPISFPYCVGQLPISYNEYVTGRPFVKGVEDRFRSKYIDVPNEPLYPFGFGLSYASFEISQVQLSSKILKKDCPITAKVTVKNVGSVPGTETVQLYIRDIAASVVRPVKELKGFRKVKLNPGKSVDVSFEIQKDMLMFCKEDGRKECEEGKFQVWIGTDSTTKNVEEFHFV